MARWFVDRLPQRGIPSVSLRRLLPEAQFVGCADWEVSGCCDDHRRLDPGQVFVAVRGARPGYDGHAFVREALERGAAGVVVERPCPDAGRLQVVVPDAMAAHARICQALAGDPSHHLLTAGVTGSFGRTITALMVRSIFEAAGAADRPARRPGLLRRHDPPSAGGRAGPAAPAADEPGAAAPGPDPGRWRGAAGVARRRLDRPPGAFIPGAAGLAALMSEMVELGLQGGRARGRRRGDDAPSRSRASPSTPRWRPTSARPRVSRRGRRSAGDGPRPGCSARSCPGAWRWSTPTTPTPRSWAASTSTPGGSPSRWSRRPGPTLGVGRLGPDRAARRSGHADDPPRLRPRGLRRSSPLVGPRAAACRPGRGGPGLGPGDRPRRRRRRAGARSRRSPGTSRRSTRARTSTSGSTPPTPPRHSARPWPPCGPSAPGGCTASWVPRAAATAPSAGGWPRPPRPAPTA